MDLEILILTWIPCLYSFINFNAWLKLIEFFLKVHLSCASLSRIIILLENNCSIIFRAFHFLNIRNLRFKRFTFTYLLRTISSTNHATIITAMRWEINRNTEYSLIKLSLVYARQNIDWRLVVSVAD